MLDVAAARACGSAPCPLCDATGTDADGSLCRACGGTALYHPYPWTAPDDTAAKPPRAMYTLEEAAILAAAPSLRLAFCGYYGVYGSTRSDDSIKHAFYRLREGHPLPIWTEGMLDMIDQAPSAVVAVTTMRDNFPGLPVSDKRLRNFWYEMHPQAAR